MSTLRLKRGYQRVAGVTFDSYVRMRDDRRNRHLRMAYNDGVLELMSPEYLHDRQSRRIYTLIYAYAGAFQVPCEAAGSTTFRKGEPGQFSGKGREADESFYIGDAVQQILGKDSLDLSIDPPPSLWVEVDNWGSSAAKLPTYAGLGVPEVWRYRVQQRRLWFGQLVGSGYQRIAESRTLPGLTPELVIRLLAEGATRPGAEWGEWLRSDWFPSHRQSMGL